MATAQWDVPECSIRYAYDDAGNRVAKYWYCENGMALQDTHDAEVLAAELQVEPDERKSEGRVLEPMELDLFPNPSSDVVTIALTGLVDHATYDVYDAQGQRVLHGTMQGNRLDIATTGIPSGLYHFCLTRGREMLVRPFVVKH
ncbi:MAG TPA: T9SS type A sorting domain-containing protein [Flavobacteriales bacterium]|nr:T9SS type A sorting domain-containing protein [Flavobacteriales bacterium]